MRLFHAVTAIAGFALGTVGASAQTVLTDIDGPEQAAITTKTGRTYTLGLGIAYAPDYEGSDYYTAVPLWNVRVGNLYHPETFVQVLGPTLRSNLLPDDHWRLGVSGRYQPDYDNVDNSQVQDIKDTEADGLLGVTLGYDFIAERGRDLALEADAQYDVLNGNGGIVTPRLRWQSPLSESLIVNAALSATWGSEDYMGNRFSINSGGAARSGLDEYDADTGFTNARVTGTVTYRFTDAWSLVGLAAVTAELLGDAADSPIVEDQGDDNQFLGALLVNYSF